MTLAEIKGNLGIIAVKCQSAHALNRQGDVSEYVETLNEIIYGLKAMTLKAIDLKREAANEASMNDLVASGGIVES